MHFCREGKHLAQH